MNIIWKFIGFISAVCATVLACLSVAYLFYPTQFGRARANLDLMRNHYEIRYLGLMFNESYYKKCFNENGITYARVAGCVVNIPIIESTKAYNEVMRDAILRELRVDVDIILNTVEPDDDNERPLDDQDSYPWEIPGYRLLI